MECIKLITVTLPDFRKQKVPCGKCAYCLTNKRSEWMFRIHHEMRTQVYPGWFITLTYDEKHVKRVRDSEGKWRLSLRFRDVQLYLKRLRKAKHYAKYICVGEYGSSTMRPHYHLILWTDASPETLQSSWKSSRDGSVLGHIHFGVLNMASAMYALKYIIQPKQKGTDGIEKRRAQFSRGLGLNYLDTQTYYYHTEDYDEPVLTSRIDGKIVALPRYYRRKIFTKHQLKKEASKRQRELIRERRDRRRDLKAKGFADPDLYWQELRLVNAEKIIRKTKYSEIL